VSFNQVCLILAELTFNGFVNSKNIITGRQKITKIYLEKLACPPKTDPFAMLGFGSKI
jgi:hypothetical protein